MKTLKITLGIAIAAIIASCNMNDDHVQGNLSSEIAGIYSGALTSSLSQIANPATAEITSINNYTIQVHCYNADIDTTFSVELYPDSKMMRVCSTDGDFKNEYGHSMSANHHMMGNNGNWTSWSQHMSNEHSVNDKHYGYFDMSANTFDYTIIMNGSNGAYEQRFMGSKQ